MSGYLKQHTGTVELSLNLVLLGLVGRVEAGGGLVGWRPGLMARSAGVVGGGGSVDHRGVGWRLRLGLDVRTGGSTEGSPGRSVGSGGTGGGSVVLLGVKIQKTTERAVGIRLEIKVDYN